MKPLILCYSFTGRTKKVCGSLAKALKADFAEIKEISRRGVFLAYTLGSFNAIRRRASDIRPVLVDTSAYDCLIVATPVWAGHVTPAVNDFVREYDLRGKTVYGLVTFAGRAGEAPGLLAQELEMAGASCPNVAEVQTTPEMMRDLKEGRKVFALDGDNRLVLVDGAGK